MFSEPVLWRILLLKANEGWVALYASFWPAAEVAGYRSMNLLGCNKAGERSPTWHPPLTSLVVAHLGIKGKTRVCDKSAIRMFPTTLLGFHSEPPQGQQPFPSLPVMSHVWEPSSPPSTGIFLIWAINTPEIWQPCGLPSLLHSYSSPPLQKKIFNMENSTWWPLVHSFAPFQGLPEG